MLTYKFPSPVSVGCFSLYYHMYGSNVGGLAISSKDSQGKVTNWWAKRGSQGDKWTKMAVSITKPISTVSIVYCLSFLMAVPPQLLQYHILKVNLFDILNEHPLSVFSTVLTVDINHWGGWRRNIWRYCY